MTEKTEETPIPLLHEVLIYNLVASRDRLATQLGHTERALQMLNRNGLIIDDFEFEVILTSRCDDETSVTQREKGPLKQVVVHAADEFKKVNRRSDVQARFSAYLVLGEDKNKFSLRIPDEFVEPHLKEKK